MKRLKLLVLTLLIHLQVNSQVYEPLNLDTSCIWLHQYDYYSTGGTYYCGSRFISFIEKDSVINGLNYWKIVSYMGDPSSCNPQSILHKYGALIREDTSLKQVYKFNGLGESILLDYSKNVGDTIRTPCEGNSGRIDSIAYKYFMGNSRRVYLASIPMVPNYKLIEGIGANYNFPICGYNEWGIPQFKLICFQKNGQTIFSEDSTVSCTKQIPTNVSLNEYNEIRIQTSARIIYIYSNSKSNTPITIYGIDGKVLKKFQCNSGINQFHLDDLVAGIYFIDCIEKGSHKVIKAVLN